MKTKAEAIAMPEAGDQWREQNGSVKTIIVTNSNDVYWRRNTPINYRDGRLRRFTKFPSTWGSFRRWAEKAEYIGNEKVN